MYLKVKFLRNWGHNKRGEIVEIEQGQALTLEKANYVQILESQKIKERKPRGRKMKYKDTHKRQVEGASNRMVDEAPSTR